jgi:hypothetical protein
MARGRKRKETGNTEVTEFAPLKIEEKIKPAKPVENKVKFLVWFSEALGRFKQLKPHHMGTVKTYLIKDLGLGEADYSSAFDDGLYKFGFGRK